MQIEITTDKKELIDKFSLHDTRLEGISWSLDEDVITFKMSGWQWDNEGELQLNGIAYVAASAVDMWVPPLSRCRNPFYINDTFIDKEFDIAQLFLRCTKESGTSEFKNYPTPDANKYFCFGIQMTTGDILRFVVEKVIWKPTKK